MPNWRLLRFRLEEDASSHAVLPTDGMKRDWISGVWCSPWHTIPLEDLTPLLRRQFVVGQEIMLARVLLKKGCIVPEHSHHNEQLTYIVEGALKFYIDGKEIVVHAGEVLCIPSNM